MYFYGLLATATLLLGLVHGEEIIRVPIQRNPHSLSVLKKRLNNENNNQLDKRELLFNAFGREYLIEVQVGTPAQAFNLTLDTGSSELWVPTSKSLNLTKEAFSIQYGIGNAKGVYGYDTVALGDAIVTNQKIGLVSKTQSILGVVTNGVQSNGIFGLGYPGLNIVRGAHNDQPFAFSLLKQQEANLVDSVFSIYLNHFQQTGYSGEILFGGIDKTKLKGDIQYAPVVNYNVINHQPISPNVGSKNGTRAANGVYLYWTVPGQSVSTSKGFNYDIADMAPFVLDTGSTMTYVPANVLTPLVKSLSQSIVYDSFNMIYRADCSLKNNDQDTVNFKVSTSITEKKSAPQDVIDISVPVSQLIIPVDTNDLNTAKTCMFAIAEGSDLPWVLGEATLRAIYSVYDMKNNRVGIAPIANTDMPSPNGKTLITNNNAKGQSGSSNKPSTSLNSSNANANDLSTSMASPGSKFNSSILFITLMFVSVFIC
ncbi:unnamed protein product [Cunninghamella blakesleeana]